MRSIISTYSKSVILCLQADSIPWTHRRPPTGPRFIFKQVMPSTKQYVNLTKNPCRNTQSISNWMKRS